ncbi:MAG: response regulator [Candidatus Dormibacteria bacterium]
MPRILLAEDHLDLRTLLDMNFTMRGFTVIAVEDGQAALEQLESANPDALVTDLMMPRLDGTGLCRAVRADPRFAGLPILVLTAADDETRREVALLPGVRVLRKPPSFKDLAPIVQEMIDNHERSRSAPSSPD